MAQSGSPPIGACFILSDCVLVGISASHKHLAAPPPPARVIGAMWQLGVLTGKPCTLGVKNGSFSAFWRHKKNERFLKALEVRLHIPSPCLDTSNKRSSTGVHGIERVSTGYDPGQNLEGH